MLTFVFERSVICELVCEPKTASIGRRRAKVHVVLTRLMLRVTSFDSLQMRIDIEHPSLQDNHVDVVLHGPS